MLSCPLLRAPSALTAPTVPLGAGLLGGLSVSEINVLARGFADTPEGARFLETSQAPASPAAPAAAETDASQEAPEAADAAGASCALAIALTPRRSGCRKRG